jgi:hypothetical protein
LRIDEEIELWLNPFYVQSIEPHEFEPTWSTIWLASGDTIIVNLTPKQFEQKYKKFMQENVLQKVYKEMRSGRN